MRRCYKLMGGRALTKGLMTIARNNYEMKGCWWMRPLCSIHEARRIWRDGGKPSILRAFCLTIPTLRGHQSNFIFHSMGIQPVEMIIQNKIRNTFILLFVSICQNRICFCQSCYMYLWSYCMYFSPSVKPNQTEVWARFRSLCWRCNNSQQVQTYFF